MTKHDHRAFLNRASHGGLAAIRTHINAHDSGHVHAYIDITDCSRLISLDFDFSTSEEDGPTEDRENILAKARALRRAIDRFVRDLEEYA